MCQSNKLSEKRIVKILDWTYDQAVNGIPGFDSAITLAENYQKKGDSKVDQVNALIRWQNTKAAISGFVTGLGGIITLPVTIPANITVVLFVQIRMIGAIAHIGGHDLKDDQVQTAVYACLAGHAVTTILKDTGMIVGNKLAINAVKGISGKTLTAINQKVGFRLLTKFGEKGVINFGKVIPLVGGIIGGSFDAFTTNRVGDVARKLFIEEPLQNKI